MTAEIVFDHVYTRALQGEPCLVHGADRLPVDLPLSAWSAGAGSSDRMLLSHCHGPTLDIGCGPGRMAQELAQRGIRVLGVDVIAEAVRQTRARGVGALLRDVFDPLPGEGRWETALLADGNIGIGGDPVRLLRRVHELLAPGGGVVADVGAPGAGLHLHELTLECGGSHSDPFPWALVGAEQVAGLAAETGFSVRLVDTIGGRWFTVLESQG